MHLPARQRSLTDSTISGTGSNNYGLASRSTSTGSNAAPSTITLLNTSVSSLGSGSSAAFVNNGSKLEIGGSKSIIEGNVNGIVITADANVLANGTNIISLTNQSLLKNLGVGDGEAAFKVGERMRTSPSRIQRLNPDAPFSMLMRPKSRSRSHHQEPPLLREPILPS